MNEEEFKIRLNIDRPALNAWGSFVVSKICEKLVTLGKNTETFLKIPPTFRVKDTDSAIAKAFIRKKGNYTNPYEDMTDKVGARFVALLTNDVDLLCELITKCEDWAYSKDRDYEEERLKQPLVFQYQSVHFVVRSKGLKIGEADIRAGTPCEIQVRTLLQHAYSELTHDTIYKPKVAASPDVHRMIARSMALIETTDEIFSKATNTISTHGGKTIDNLGKIISDLYSELISNNFYHDPRVNALIIDSYSGIVPSDIEDKIKKFYRENEYLTQKIKSRGDTEILFRQPASLLVYYLVKATRHAAKSSWPLTKTELQPFFTDQGIAFS